MFNFKIFPIYLSLYLSIYSSLTLSFSLSFSFSRFIFLSTIYKKIGKTRFKKARTIVDKLKSKQIKNHNWRHNYFVNYVSRLPG